MDTIDINLDRLDYLLELFNYSQDDFLRLLNEGRKNALKKADVFNSHIKLSLLKKIDNDYFKQGLNFYTNPVNLVKDDKASIFFRKPQFNTELTLADHQKVLEVEKEIRNVTTLAKLSDFSFIERKVKVARSSDDPRLIANQVRDLLFPQGTYTEDKKFLTALINKLGEFNIFVFEILEHHNAKHKMSLDGFFIYPNVIGIKRQQYSFKREIFTLAHELGHYMLDEEEIDQPVVGQKSSSDIEKWCDAFAFAFICPIKVREELNSITEANLDVERISTISQQLHISRLALYTQLAVNKQISWGKYKDLKLELHKDHQNKAFERELDKQRKKELAALTGKPQGGGSPKPIYSELEKKVYRYAFLSGVVEEYDILKHFRISKSTSIDRFVYG
ncbi:ImmA/IrrE family metallo-endopeptidase [Gammaproteobacteria bacterium]|nr:ImmA/IrrE family metallo-endopeptidase [Gammaproteobacteria bacterium]